MGRERIETLLNGAEETRAFAAQFARSLAPQSILALHGDLGAGKTTFMQGLVQGLGGSADEVHSPTFVYLHTYLAKCPVYHFDLYRLPSLDDFLGLGFNEYLNTDGITAFEWPEKIASLLPPQTLRISLSSLSEQTRRVVIE